MNINLIIVIESNYFIIVNYIYFKNERLRSFLILDFIKMNAAVLYKTSNSKYG